MRCWIGLKERLLVRKELVATLSVLITNLEPSEENETMNRELEKIEVQLDLNRTTDGIRAHQSELKQEKWKQEYQNIKETQSRLTLFNSWLRVIIDMRERGPR